MREYTSISDIEPELLNIFREFFEFESNEELTFYEMRGLIRDAGDEKESVDSGHIYTDFKLEIGDYLFTASGSEYIKDGGLCDFEWEDIIEIKKKIKKTFNVKLLTLGHGRHGKDSFAEIMAEEFGLKFKSSSQAAAEIFIYDMLKGQYGYTTPEECFGDRVNHRKEWHDLICDYNVEDKAKLAKGILELNDCYVGMRDRLEIEECMKQGLFDLIVWIDASERLPLESSDSFNIDKSCADVIIENNGTFEEFKTKVIRLGKILSNKL